VELREVPERSAEERIDVARREIRRMVEVLIRSSEEIDGKERYPVELELQQVLLELISAANQATLIQEE
jgi:hypothetical protein